MERPRVPDALTGSYYTWLSGDTSSNKAIHNVDTIVWAFNAHRVRAIVPSETAVRRAPSPSLGHIYDHTIDYGSPTARTA